MAVKTLIMGESGTGKSTSMRNFKPEEIAIVNPVNKPLPFKGKFEKLNGVTDCKKIINFMNEAVKAGKKTIVVDDFQYILSIPYMNRIKEAGWDKWNDFGSNYFEIIDHCDELPEDVTVYFLTHTETLDDGTTTIKLIGKLLREKITIEGLFTIVLRTMVDDGKYVFLTQNSGKDTVKSPLGMFDSYAIDNDLKYVDQKIRSYYEFGEFLSDDEIKEIDEAAKVIDVIKPDSDGRKRRSNRKAETEETPVKKERATRRKKATEESKATEPTKEELAEAATSKTEDDITFEEKEASTEKPKRSRRTRKAPEEVSDVEMAKIEPKPLDEGTDELPLPVDEGPKRRKRRARG